jgi:2'-5' RNA ligase
MTFSLQLFFDPAGDAAVRHMWSRLEQAGVSSLATRSHRRHQPHVTLAGARHLVVNDTALDAIHGLQGSELILPMLGVFPGKQAVVLLGATVTAELLSAHAAIHCGIEQGSEDIWELYRPGSWVPHCSLAMGVEANDLMTVIASLHPHSPITVRVTQIGMVDNETGHISHVP